MDMELLWPILTLTMSKKMVQEPQLEYVKLLSFVFYFQASIFLVLFFRIRYFTLILKFEHASISVQETFRSMLLSDCMFSMTLI